MTGLPPPIIFFTFITIFGTVPVVAKSNWNCSIYMTNVAKLMNVKLWIVTFINIIFFRLKVMENYC